MAAVFDKFARTVYNSNRATYDSNDQKETMMVNKEAVLAAFEKLEAERGAKDVLKAQLKQILGMVGGRSRKSKKPKKSKKSNKSRKSRR